MIQAEPKKGKSELLATNDFDDFTEIGDSNSNNILEGIMFIDK